MPNDGIQIGNTPARPLTHVFGVEEVSGKRSTGLQTIDEFVQYLIGLAGLDPSIILPLNERITQEIADRAAGDAALSLRAPVVLSNVSRDGDNLTVNPLSAVSSVTSSHSFWLFAQYTNAGPMTVKIGAFDPIPLLNTDGSDLIAGQFQTNAIYQLKPVIINNVTTLRLTSVNTAELLRLAARAPGRLSVTARTGDLLSVTPDPMIPSLQLAQSFWIVANHTNAGALTARILKTDGTTLEEVPIYNADGVDFAAGEWKSGRQYLLRPFISGSIRHFRLVSGNVMPGDLRSLADPISVTERVALDQLARERSWPSRPRLGLNAVPDAATGRLSYTRTGAATRYDDLGVLTAVPAGQAVHDFDAATGEYRGWRFDPAKTLASLWSADFAQTYWTKSRCTVAPAASPGPTLRGTADRILETVDDATHGVGRLTGNADLAAGTKAFLEIVFRPIGRRYLAFGMDAASYTARMIEVDAEAGLVTGSADFVAGSLRLTRITAGPYAGFIHVAGTLNVTQALTAVRYYTQSRSDTRAASFAGDPAKGYDLAHFSWGVGDYVPGIIESADTAAVRGAPAMWSAGTMSMAEGTILCEVTVNALPVTAAITRAMALFVANENQVVISINAAGRWYMTYNGGGTTAGNSQAFPSSPGADLAVKVGQRQRVAISWKAGRQLLSVDGVVYEPATHIATVPSGLGELVLAKQFRTSATVTACSIAAGLAFGHFMDTDALARLTAPSSASGGVGYAVDVSWAEVAQDPSRDAILKWIAADGRATAAEYRVVGSTSWMSAGATKLAFPGTTKQVYGAPIKNLSEATLYEWRPAGSGDDKIKRFRTAPSYLSRPLRVCCASDWQRDSANALSATSDFNVLNGFIGGRAYDVVILNGDFASDDGVVSAAVAQRWIDFMKGWTTYMVDADGALPLVAAVAGNHEGYDLTPGAAGGAYNAVGEYGYMHRVFSTFYRDKRAASNVGGRGYGWFEIGKEILFVGLETNHVTPIAEQVPWLRDLLAAKAGQYRHLVVFGHMGTVGARDDLWNEWPHRVMREQIAPIVQGYPNAKFLLSAHNHVLLATKKVKFVENPPGAPKDAWRQDANGLRTLGAGGWGAPSSTDFNAQNRASDATLGDGSVLIDYLVATNQPARGITPISAPNNTSTDPATRHFWDLEFSETTQAAKAISLNNTALVTFTENVPA